MTKSILFVSTFVLLLNVSHAQEMQPSDGDDMIELTTHVDKTVLLVEENAQNAENADAILMSEKKVKELSEWTPIPALAIRGQVMFLYFSIGAQVGVRTLNGMLESGIYISRFMFGAATTYEYGTVTGLYGQVALVKDKNGNNARIYLKGRVYNYAYTNVITNHVMTDATASGKGIGGSVGFILCGKKDLDLYAEIAGYKFCPSAIEINWDHSSETWKSGYKGIHDVPSFTILFKI